MRKQTWQAILWSLIATAVATALAGPTIAQAQTVVPRPRQGARQWHFAKTSPPASRAAPQLERTGATLCWACRRGAPPSMRAPAPDRGHAERRYRRHLDLAARGAEIAPGTLEVQSKPGVWSKSKRRKSATSCPVRHCQRAADHEERFLEFADLVPGMAFWSRLERQYQLAGCSAHFVLCSSDGVSPKEPSRQGGGTIGQTGARQW